jgi:hypothetical protein
MDIAGFADAYKQCVHAEQHESGRWRRWRGIVSELICNHRIVRLPQHGITKGHASTITAANIVAGDKGA